MRSKHVITYLVYLTISTQLFGQNKINWEEDLIYMRSYLEIMHPHLYDFITQEEFNKDYDYLMKNWQKLDDAKIVTQISEIFAKIQDGHTGCGFLYEKNKYIRGLFHYYPLWLYKFSDGVYVLYAKKEYRELIGKKILRMGNLPIDKAVKQLMRMNIGDNDWGKSQQFYLIQEFLQYTGILNKNESELKLIYEKDGETLSYVLKGPESAEDYYLAPKVFPQKDSVIITMNDDCIKPLPLYLSHLYNEDGYSGNN